MRDVVKSMPDGQRRAGQQGSAAPRRRKRRRRNLSLYYLMIFLICGFILFILSRTLLFRVNEYIVTGNERYSAEEILNAANLKTGKNMYGIDTEEAEKKIMEELIYIESVSVERKLPDKMMVTVTEAEEFACCQYEDSRYAVITRSGRYLQTEQASPTEGIMQIYGLELTGVERGGQISSTDENKITILMQLLDAIDEICPGKISYIDMTDRTDITMGYDGRIDIEFGSSLDYEYKLRYISAIVENNLEPGATGRIIYHSAAAGVSFITSEDLAQMEQEMAQREEQAQSQQEAQNQQNAQDGENVPDGGENQDGGD